MKQLTQQRAMGTQKQTTTDGLVGQQARRHTLVIPTRKRRQNQWANKKSQGGREWWLPFEHP
jgi:hypothetical protein